MTALDVRRFDSLASCRSLSAEMARVNAAAPRPCPFSTYEFLSNHIEHNGLAPGTAGARPLILTAFRGGELVGYLPLRRTPERVFGRTCEKIEYLVMHDIDRPHLVARKEDLGSCTEAFYRTIMANEREWTFLEFEQQDQTSTLYPLPPSIDAEDFYLREFENASNATIDVVHGSISDYFRAFSKKMRNNIRRYARRLFDAGEVELISSEAPEGLPRLLDVYRSVEARSWKNGIDWVVGDDPRRLNYFRGLMSPQQPMRISVDVLALAGVPIAAIINGRFLDGLHALQIAYDEAFREMDPGAMLLLLSMKKAIAGRCAVFDLLSGYGYFKERWQARITPSRSIQLYRLHSLHHLKARAGELKRLLASKWAAKTHALRNPARDAVKTQPDGSAAASRRASSALALLDVRGSGVPLEVVGKKDLLAGMPFLAGE